MKIRTIAVVLLVACLLIGGSVGVVAADSHQGDWPHGDNWQPGHCEDWTPGPDWDNSDGPGRDHDGDGKSG